MKRIAAVALIALLSLTCSAPMYAGTTVNPELRAAQKRYEKQQKAIKKQAKKQQKAMKEDAKAREKALRKAQKEAAKNNS